VATWEVFSDGDCSEKGFDTGQCATGQGQSAKVDLGGSKDRVANVSEPESAKVGANRLKNLQADMDNSLLASGLGDNAGVSRDQVRGLWSSGDLELAGMGSVDVEEREVVEAVTVKENVNLVHLEPGPGILGPFETSPNNSQFWLNNPSLRNTDSKKGPPTKPNVSLKRSLLVRGLSQKGV
jgi:hypothetical protein